jgi:hypothetical protein
MRSSNFDQRPLETKPPNGKPRGRATNPNLHMHICVAIWPVHEGSISQCLQEPPPLLAILKASQANESNTGFLPQRRTAGVLELWNSEPSSPLLCMPVFLEAQHGFSLFTTKIYSKILIVLLK